MNGGFRVDFEDVVARAIHTSRRLLAELSSTTKMRAVAHGRDGGHSINGETASTS